MAPRTLHRLARPVGSVLLVLGIGLGALPASASVGQRPPPEPRPVPGQSLLPPSPAPETAPELDDVVLVGADNERATERFEATRRARSDALAAIEEHGATLVEATADEVRLTAAVAEATDRRRRDERALGRAQERVKGLAVSDYVNGREGGDNTALLDLDAGATNDAGRERMIATAVRDDTIADLRTARAGLAESTADVDRETTARDELRTKMDETAEKLAQARRDDERLAVEVLMRLEEKRATSRLSTVRGTELPLVVLDAYYKASQHLAWDEPSCGISWWGLAGIGYIESGHGTFGDATVLPNGDVSVPIVGIALDGTNNTAVIADSDAGYYDGDLAFDRAVGPMQFIPQTWESWKRDGNGDGRFDPQNLYDAAYAAAAYTCAGGPMRSDEDLSRGYFSYNHDPAYVLQVVARARSYAAAVALPPPAPLPPTTPATPPAP